MKTTYYLTKEELEQLINGEEVVLYSKFHRIANFKYIDEVVQIKYLPLENEV